jgi:hypothetical protein
MSLKSISISLLLASLTVSSPIERTVLESRQLPCSPIHLLVARGSNEPPGPGQLFSLVNGIFFTNPGVTFEPIVYPALYMPADYPGSVRAGTLAVQGQLAAYVQRCPFSKIVLLGYSQGAQIIGDALCGGNSAGDGPITPPIDPSFSSHGVFVAYYDSDIQELANNPYSIRSCLVRRPTKRRREALRCRNCHSRWSKLRQL